MYREPTSNSWLLVYRCLARQCPLVSPLFPMEGYCSSVSLGRCVLDGPPQRWLSHPRRSWLVPVRQLNSQSSPRSDGGPLLTAPVADWTRSVLQHSLGSNLYFTELSNSNTLGQPLLSLIYPLCLLAVTLHACSQDNTHGRRPSFGHCWILRIQRARPTSPRQVSFHDVI